LKVIAAEMGHPFEALERQVLLGVEALKPVEGLLMTVGPEQPIVSQKSSFLIGHKWQLCPAFATKVEETFEQVVVASVEGLAVTDAENLEEVVSNPARMLGFLDQVEENKFAAKVTEVAGWVEQKN
jgi:hypothetical protein